MSLEFKIEKHISARTYNFEKKNSRSYIKNEYSRYEYMLKNIASDVWYMLLSTENYSMVYDYACKKNIENELDDFLYELENEKLIKIIKNSKEKNIINTKETPYSEKYENEDEFEEEQYKWLMKNNYLQNLSLQLSYKCNEHCKQCFNDKTHNNLEISLEEVKQIIDEAYLLGISTVGITGGECTIHKDFLEILKYIRQKHLSVRILTNGQTLHNDKFLEEITSYYPNLIKISLHSMNPETHDNFTGIKGSHEKTIKVIKKLREKNMPVTISYLTMKENKEDYKAVIEFGDKFGAGVSVSSYFINNPNNKNSNLELSSEELEELYQKSDWPHSPVNSTIMGYKKENAICHAGYRTLAIAPNLDVTPCNDFNYILGNLKQDSLTKIWNEKIPEFKKIFNWEQLKDCQKYDYCRYCNYCPTPGFLKSKKITKSESCCKNAKAYQKALQLIRKN